MKPLTHKAILWVLAVAGFAAWLAVMLGTIQVQPGSSGTALLREAQSTRDGEVHREGLTRTGEGTVEALIGFDK